MDNKLTKKYGLFTAIAMVVGIVIGSGIFFKAQDILKYTGGNIFLGVIAWLIGGAVMLICAYTFSILATKYEKVNGIVDYAEETCSKNYAYMVGWFLATIYYPSLTAVLSWVSARYTCILMGIRNSSGGTECLLLSGFFLTTSFFLNALAPKISGKLQVSTTVIKLIPLILMAVVGSVVGFSNGNLSSSINEANYVNTDISLFGAIVSAIFAYDGWIVATSINSEIKNSKRNLPIALILGSLIVVLVYVSYFIGISKSVPVDTLITHGATEAFIKIFGKGFGVLLNVFVVISCFGTLNGLMLGTARGVYSIAARNEGIKPEIFKEVSVTGIPVNSAIAGLMLSYVWLVFWYGSVIRTEFNNELSWFGSFIFDSSELPIITLYSMYIPIFFMMLKKEKDLNKFKRFVAPTLSIIACIFMVLAAIIAHKNEVLNYLLLFFVVMLIGRIFMRSKN